MQTAHPQPPIRAWNKAISSVRDRGQSRALVAAATPLLLAAVALSLRRQVLHGAQIGLLARPMLLSAGFALLVWRLRSATLPAALLGGIICLALARTAGPGGVPLDSVLPFFSPGIAALVALFVLTFAATRFGRATKQRRGLAESRRGRQASQIVANLTVAALFGAEGFYAAALAALGEATADTVSSEVGQALGGPTWMLTTGRRVAPGTDGGVSLRGTLAGVLAALLVVLAGSVSAASSPVVWGLTFRAFAAACGGLIFDSLLGATVERRGWLGNDLVNFLSTLFTAGLTLLWL